MISFTDPELPFESRHMTFVQHSWEVNEYYKAMPLDLYVRTGVGIAQHKTKKTAYNTIKINWQAENVNYGLIG